MTKIRLRPMPSFHLIVTLHVCAIKIVTPYASERYIKNQETGIFMNEWQLSNSYIRIDLYFRDAWSKIANCTKSVLFVHNFLSFS